MVLIVHHRGPSIPKNCLFFTKKIIEYKNIIPSLKLLNTKNVLQSLKLLNIRKKNPSKSSFICKSRLVIHTTIAKILPFSTRIWIHCFYNCITSLSQIRKKTIRPLRGLITAREERMSSGREGEKEKKCNGYMLWERMKSNISNFKLSGIYMKMTSFKE